MDLGSWVRTERVVEQLRVGNKDNLTAESAAMTANNPDDQVATGRGQRRRSVVRGALAGLGGLATGSLVPGLVPSARSATAIVTPDPIRTRIQQGELTARARRVRSAVRGRQPRQALLGRSIHRCRQDSAGPQESPRQRLRRADQPAGHGLSELRLPSGRGRAGRPGRHKIYTVSTETVASRPAGVPLLSGPYPVIFRLGQDEAGEIYVLTKRDGKIRKLAPALA